MDASLAALGPEVRNRHDFQYGSDLLRIFWRRKLLVFSTVMTVSVIAAAYAWFATPIYKATASIMVSASSVTPLGSFAATPGVQDETLIANQNEILSSRAVARDVASDLDLTNDVEFNPSIALKGRLNRADVLENVTDELQRHVEIRRDGRSAIIAVTVSSTSPEKAAHLANTFISSHLAYQRSSKAASTQSNSAALRPQVEKLRQQVIAADGKVAAYRRAHNISGPVEAPDLAQLGRLFGNLADARSSSTEAAARANVAVPGPLATASSGATSPLLNDLRRQSAELSKRVAELSAFYGAGYPALVNANAQLADTNRRVTDEAARVARELRGEVTVGRAREGQISSDLAQLRGQSFAERTATVGLLDLEREAEANRLIYVDLLQRLRQIDGQSQLYQVPAQIFARAVPPDEPAFPHRKEIVVVAALGSFVLGLILTFAVELIMERRIRTGEQAERLLGAPMLGMVPWLPAQRGGAFYKSVAHSPASPFAEAARSLFLEVCQYVPLRRSPVVLITSPLPGEGKTTLALTLGAAAAQWRSTVVVDLDLRRPGILEAVGAPRRNHDLISYLRGMAALDDIVVTAGTDRLTVIGVNQRPDDPAVLLSSPLLIRLIEALRERYDFVVLTAPPLLAVRDAKTLACFASATLLVLRWNKTHTDAVLAAARFFGKPFTGVVINQVDFAKHARSASGDLVQHHFACASYYADGALDARATA